MSAVKPLSSGATTDRFTENPFGNWHRIGDKKQFDLTLIKRIRSYCRRRARAGSAKDVGDELATLLERCVDCDFR